MIYKIKNLYDDGNGLSLKKIAKKLSISKNTVRKYVKMSPEEIAEYKSAIERAKLLDPYKEFIISILQRYEKMSATKIKRKCEERGVETDISERTYRRFVEKLKKTVLIKQIRNYEPVIDMLPGVQCQVDLGEAKTVISGKTEKIYFCVFVLSYSRLMYISISSKPITTSTFIKMHNEAFAYFEGVPEECVYDQTKLVVIKEKYREVWLNEEFSKYAASVNFSIRVCEGYDPESKGKVESGVKYVKDNFFYGEEFSSTTELKEKANDWLNNISNTRIHGTHKQQPFFKYNTEEKEYMKPFLKPAYLQTKETYETRKVDKTSLISYKSNKYSVPFAYQNHMVYIQKEKERLIIMEMETEKVIATHSISYKTGDIVKNINHYRDHEKTIKDREAEVHKALGKDLSTPVCALLKISNPKIYKDQLVGLLHLIKTYKSNTEMDKVFAILKDKSTLKVSQIENYLKAYKTVDSKEKSVEYNKTKASGKLSLYSALNTKKGNGYVNF